MEDFRPTKYKLRCVATGRVFEDDGLVLEDRQCNTPSLIRTEYEVKCIDIRSDDSGIYKFCDWLPVRRTLKGSAAPVTYKSEGLAAHLGLDNLYITFSGYFPEKGAEMTTCSFKETEAYSVCGRFDESAGRILVVASAGNTARAFAKVCSENNIPLLLSVPEDNLDALWFEEPLNDCVKLIAAQKGGDYFDAIHLSNVALKSGRFIAEGGAKNVARRDGMATTVLSAAAFIGRIPDYYFQAVGSGTGAIAAWEAAMRLEADGRFGPNRMKLMVSQNAPFVPMYDAWRADSRHMLPYDDHRARRDAGIIDAKVLSNRRPPYGRIVRCLERERRRFLRFDQCGPSPGGQTFRADGGHRHTPCRCGGGGFADTSREAGQGRQGGCRHAERDRRRGETLQGGPADVVSETLHRIPSDGFRNGYHRQDGGPVRPIVISCGDIRRVISGRSVGACPLFSR